MPIVKQHRQEFHQRKKENIMNPPYISSNVIDGLISTPTKVIAANIIDNIKNIFIILISIS